MKVRGRGGKGGIMKDEEKRKGKEREIRRKRKGKKAGWVGLELATTKNDFYENGLSVCSVYTHCLLLDGETLFKASIRYR